MLLQSKIELIENFGQIIKLKLQKLSIIISNNSEIDDILKEITLDGIQNG
jgi:hypothetical protein